MNVILNMYMRNNFGAMLSAPTISIESHRLHATKLSIYCNYFNFYLVNKMLFVNVDNNTNSYRVL